MRVLLRLLAASLLFGLLALPASATAAGDRHPGHDPDIGPPPISADKFLTRAAAANRFEIVTGQLAQERAKSAVVKALGAEFVAHHTALLEQGAAVAAQLGIAVPADLPPELQAVVDRLERKSGKRFDRAWVAAQLAAHRDALLLNLRGAIAGEHPAIRTLAQGALPIITHHLGELIDLVRASGGHHRWNRHGHDDGDHRR